MRSVERALKNLEASIKSWTGKKSKERLVLAEDLLLSLRVAQKLLWWDTYQESLSLLGDLKVDNSQVDEGEIAQLRRILVQSVNQIDLDSLAKANRSQFRKCLKNIKEKLSSGGNEIKIPVGKNKIETVRIRLEKAGYV